MPQPSTSCRRKACAARPCSFYGHSNACVEPGNLQNSELACAERLGAFQMQPTVTAAAFLQGPSRGSGLGVDAFIGPLDPDLRFLTISAYLSYFILIVNSPMFDPLLQHPCHGTNPAAGLYHTRCTCTASRPPLALPAFLLPRLQCQDFCRPRPEDTLLMRPEQSMPFLSAVSSFAAYALRRCSAARQSSASCMYSAPIRFFSLPERQPGKWRF